MIWAETALAKNLRWRMVPVSLLGWLLLLLSLVWINKAALASFGLLMLGLPFVVASLALATLPLWSPVFAKRTIYAISDRRLLTIRRLLGHRVSSYGPGEIDVVERRENRDGSGDLIFRREEVKRLRHHADPPRRKRVSEREIGFWGIPDVRQVEEAVWALKMRIEHSDNEQPSDHADNGGASPSATLPTKPSDPGAG